MLKICLKIERLIYVIALTLGIVSGLFIFGIMIISNYEIIMRYGISSPTRWSFEVSTYLFIVGVFLGAAYTQTEHGHVSVDLVTSRLSPKVRGVLAIVSYLATLVYLVLFALATWGEAWLSYTRDFHSTTVMRIPLFPIQVWIPIGIILLALVVLIQTCRQATTLIKGENIASTECGETKES
jgi:TRAP-type C4-dicarboxylate transport system permease small subunit